MNQKEKISKIAEACGWKNHDHPDCMAMTKEWVTSDKWCLRPDGELVFNHDRPDYFGDLNACHEMEQIDILDADKYRSKLEIVYGLATARYDFERATAAQRAEAFGLTLGLWKEGE